MKAVFMISSQNPHPHFYPPPLLSLLLSFSSFFSQAECIKPGVITKVSKLNLQLKY